MGDAGDQAAERRQPFGVDQVLLRGVEFEQRALGLFLRGAQLVLGLALGDGVFAEHLHRARHGADLVPGGGALHAAIVIARGDRVHRRHDLLQRQADRERDQDAGGQDDAEEDHGDRQHPARDGRQRPVERLLRLLLALAHLDRQIRRWRRSLRPGWRRWCCAAARSGSRAARSVWPAPRAAPPSAPSAACSAMRCRSLSARSDITGMVFSIVSVLRRASSAEADGERQIIGVGGDQHRGERLAGFSERRPDLRVAMPGGALDDRIKPGHFPGRAQHLLLIGLGDGGLHRAQFAEAVEEAFGDVLELARPIPTASGRSRRAWSACRAPLRATAGSRRTVRGSAG